MESYTPATPQPHAPVVPQYPNVLPSPHKHIGQTYSTLFLPQRPHPELQDASAVDWSLHPVPPDNRESSPDHPAVLGILTPHWAASVLDPLSGTSTRLPQMDRGEIAPLSALLDSNIHERHQLRQYTALPLLPWEPN